MRKFFKVEGHTSLVRDSETNAILSLDEVEYSNHKRKAEIEKNKRSEIAAMKSDIDDIKAMLTQLLKGLPDVNNSSR